MSQMAMYPSLQGMAVFPRKASGRGRTSPATQAFRPSYRAKGYRRNPGHSAAMSTRSSRDDTRS